MNPKAAREVAREMEIPQPIREIGFNNRLVHGIIVRYVRGEIITKEEALCQMIAGLARDWNEVNRQNFELAMRFPEMFQPKPPTT